MIIEEEGKEPEERDLGDNLVVNGGLNALALLLSGNLAPGISSGSIGTGTTAPAKTDSSLILAVGGAAPTFVFITSGFTATCIFPTGFFGPGTYSLAITEFGFFTQIPSLYNRVVFGAITVTDKIQLTFKLDVTFG